jgi:hypothetical protein
MCVSQWIDSSGSQTSGVQFLDRILPGTVSRDRREQDAWAPTPQLLLQSEDRLIMCGGEKEHGTPFGRGPPVSLFPDTIADQQWAMRSAMGCTRIVGAKSIKARSMINVACPMHSAAASRLKEVPVCQHFPGVVYKHGLPSSSLPTRRMTRPGSTQGQATEKEPKRLSRPQPSSIQNGASGVSNWFTVGLVWNGVFPPGTFRADSPPHGKRQTGTCDSGTRCGSK